MVNNEISFNIGNGENRQHINLSNRAMRIIEKDMVYFNNDYDLKNKSGFLNKVLINYYEDFPLSPNKILKSMSRINARLTRDDIGHKTVKSISAIFKDEIMRDSIQSYRNVYENGQTFKLKLDKDATSILASYEDAHYFESYAPRSGLGFFLKILFESYAELPKEKRQYIYFKGKMSLIEKAIEKKRQLRIKLSDNYISVIPYDLKSDFDKGSLKFHYSNTIEQLEEVVVSPKVVSLSKIKEIRLGKEMNSYEKSITGDHVREVIFPNAVSNKPKIDVLVKFTSMGLRRFFHEEDEMPIIGIPVEGTKDSFKFLATESEVFWNLFKYGIDMEVKSPVWLRKKLEKFYSAASKIYRD